MKKNTLIRIGKLLDKCEECPRKPKASQAPSVCADCNIYQEMRKLGDSLHGEKPKKPKMSIIENGSDFFSMSADQYYKYKERGYSDAKIARMKCISQYTLSVWKQSLKNDQMNFIDIEEYKRLRGMGLNDYTIARRVGVSAYKFKSWKMHIRQRGEKI